MVGVVRISELHCKTGGRLKSAEEHSVEHHSETHHIRTNVLILSPTNSLYRKRYAACGLLYFRKLYHYILMLVNSIEDLNKSFIPLFWIYT